MEVLRCGCRIEDGAFIVSEGCAHCAECNTVAEMHPFGSRRLADLVG